MNKLPIDGYIEMENDIFENYFVFKQEDKRVLYPFRKIRSGGSNDFPQYFYSLEKNDHFNTD